MPRRQLYTVKICNIYTVKFRDARKAGTTHSMNMGKTGNNWELDKRNKGH